MKHTVKWITALGLLLPVTLLQSMSAGICTADLQRLQWLCSDYQVPVQGYVVESWFQIVHVPGMERFLEEKLQIVAGTHQIELADGSVLTTVMHRKEGKWTIELQLIGKSSEEAVRYYTRWQQFADRYCPNHPVGITAIAELPEALSQNASSQIVQELAEGLGLRTISEISTGQYVQLSGYTNQLFHKINVNGEAVNGSITIVPQEQRTYLYIASPVLYQQI